jgi:hypothetical protein
VGGNSGASDWAIIQNKLHNHLGPGSVRVHNGPQPIADTRNALNARIKSADGKANLMIDPTCRKIIDDLRAALWPGTMDEQHAAAWLRYFCHYAYPVAVKPRESGGRVIFSNG